MANKRIDEATSTETVGHEWDGIEELDTPMPRWWLWTFYATIVFAIAYGVAYPAWPLLEKGTEGVLGWTSRGELAAAQKAEAERRAPILAALAATPLEELTRDEAKMRAAVAGGAAAFKVNCVQCHGAGAAGSKGFPNLVDDDWLWGGDMQSIEATLVHGIRHPGDDATRNSMMPAFGRDGILTASQIEDVTSHILALGGRGKAGVAASRGAEVFTANCAVCHGGDGKGMRSVGAPSLVDAIWLYGSSRAEIVQQITNPRHGVMPAWNQRLDPVTIRMLAAYVHSLGGGEDFAASAEAAAPADAAAPGAATPVAAAASAAATANVQP